jgi:hypothetical protein
VEVAGASAAVAVFMAAASAAGDSTAVAAFMVAALVAVDFAAAASPGEGFTAVDFVAAAFAAVDFTEIGFTMATSTISFSSLTALETHSFTIPIHIMVIIPTVIIRMATILTALDTVVFGVATFAALIFTGMAFMAVVFTGVAFMAVSLTAVAPAAADDSYNEPSYRGNAWYMVH